MSAIEKFLQTGHNHLDWGSIFKEEVTPEQLQNLENEADELCQQAALLGAYLSNRRAYGHTAALQKAQPQLKKVRKALGYTYP